MLHINLYLCIAIFSFGSAFCQPSLLTTHPPLFAGFEEFHLPISTHNQQAQRYFDQGLALFFSFNFPEAARSFHEAQQHDPKSAICYWGESLALRECSRASGDFWSILGQAALLKAEVNASNASTKERDLIKALATGFKQNGIDPLRYAKNMDIVHSRYPTDPEITALYAKAFMDALNTMPEAEVASAKKEILQILKEGLKESPLHPGLNHLTIHAVEAYGNPADALTSAEKLKTLLPGSGHLQHMPAHIYFDLGRYHEASEANQRGIDADEKLYRAGGLKLQEFAAFYLHTYYYYFTSLTMEGRAADALKSSKQLVSDIKSNRQPSTPYLRDVFYSIPYLLMARFEQWDLLAKEPVPPSDLLFANGALYYARGLANIRSNKIPDAKKALTALNDLQAKIEEKPLSAILQIASLDLQGRIAAAQGDFNAQIRDLQEAVKVEQGLDTSMLPWYLPMKQALGMALLNAGRAPEAEKVFLEDLQRHPHNGWALFGLMQSLKAQHKDAAETEAAYKQAWRYADIQLEKKSEVRMGTCGLTNLVLHGSPFCLMSSGFWLLP